MTHLIDEGKVVLPGDVIYALPIEEDDDNTMVCVSAGSGCALQKTLRRNRDDTVAVVERRIVATRKGVVHWGSGTVISVVSTMDEMHEGSADQHGAGARPGDTVHLRISRVTKMAVSGDIIAVKGKWSSQKHGNFSGFRGVIRVEDIKPFRPTKDKLLPDSPEESFRPGDVVVAEVISQSDSKQFQLSTHSTSCGVVEATAPRDQGILRSVHKGRNVVLSSIAYKREELLHPVTGERVKRWAPLLTM